MRALAPSEAGGLEIRRSAITGFEQGIHYGARTKNFDTRVRIEDSVIRDNEYGIWYQGVDPRSHLPACGDEATPTGAPTHHLHVEHTDLLGNGRAIRLRASGLGLSARYLNLIDNNEVLNQSRNSYGLRVSLNDSNIVENGGLPVIRMQQVSPSPQTNISDNYWGVLSDPELAEHWRFCRDHYELSTISPHFIEEAGPQGDLIDAVRALTYAAQR